MPTNPQPAGFLRRSAALLYDAAVLLALLLLTTAIALLLNHGEPVPRVLLRTCYLVVAYAFYVGFWTHGGQTLGMRAWRLQLLASDGKRPGYGAATLRFAAAILSWAACGAGFLWILVSEHKLAWHDQLSATRIVSLAPRTS